MAPGRFGRPHVLPLAAGEGAFVGAAVSAVAGFDSTAVGLAVAGLLLFAVALVLWLLFRGRA